MTLRRFSNGCALGCETCDGTSRGPIPGSKDPHWHRKFNLCPEAQARATICDPALRTINAKADCGAADDWYYFSPWRHPGSAPVFDSCGMAGGHPPPAVGGHAGFGGVYINTTHAHLGMVGSALKPAPTRTPTVWRAGSTVEVTWAVEANHAGGYQYRLAPAAGPLTEAAFQEHPLDFVGQQGFRWAGGSAGGGSELFFNGTYASGDAVVPRGSMWAQNPVSRSPCSALCFV